MKTPKHIGYLVDTKTGRVVEERPIYVKDGDDDIERMNETARHATDGRFEWRLDKPECGTNV